jgi:hypothetical protein
MSSDILHMTAEYFELEGVPPYPSYFVPVDFNYEWWMDTSDMLRFRYEKYFSTREEPPVNGLVTCVVGTGGNGDHKECHYYDGKTECATSKITMSALSLEKWLLGFNALGHRLVSEIGSTKSGEFQYEGIETDALWGNAYLFTKISILRASDDYRDLPMTETYKFDESLHRQIEIRRIVFRDKEEIIHRLYRLTEWKLLTLAEAPEGIFNIDS